MVALGCATAACRPPATVTPEPRRAAPAAPEVGDSDGDGIADDRDRCPTVAEDLDQLEDGDGCPETDADHDRIPDDEDACPRQPGGVLADERGCPYVPAATEECPILSLAPEVTFAPNAFTLDASASDLVALIAQDVATVPENYHLVIAGHRAVDEPPDTGLERARAVRRALEEAGLDDDRFVVVNRADRDATGPTEPDRRVTFQLRARCAAPNPPDYDFQEPLPARSLPSDAPAMRYANLSPGACRAELARRDLPLLRDKRPTPGVATGVRFTDSLHGIAIIAPGKPTTYGVMDCRLALTFDDATQVLATLGVVRIRVDNTYRRGAKLPNRRRQQSQHAHGLAADITAFYLADGRELNVERDWSGERGEPVCGPDARVDVPTEGAILLRDIACDLGRHGLFHTMLTPNYNAAHRNHFHFDIKRDANRWDIH